MKLVICFLLVFLVPFDFCQGSLYDRNKVRQVGDELKILTIINDAGVKVYFQLAGSVGEFNNPDASKYLIDVNEQKQFKLQVDSCYIKFPGKTYKLRARETYRLYRSPANELDLI